jgi:hypothetical protein
MVSTFNNKGTFNNNKKTPTKKQKCYGGCYNTLFSNMNGGGIHNDISFIHAWINIYNTT